MTGCDVAIAYPPIHRSREEAQKTPDYAPIELVHSDFTDDYGPMITDPERRYRAFLDPLLERHGLTHDDVASASRLMVLQFWRNTGPTRPDYPMAFCAADGVGPDRMVREMLPEYGGLRVDSQFYAVRPPERRRRRPLVHVPRSHDVGGSRTADLRQPVHRRRPSVLDTALGVPRPERAQRRPAVPQERRDPRPVHLALTCSTLSHHP